MLKIILKNNIEKIFLKIFPKDNINEYKKINIKKCIQNKLPYFFLAELFLFP
jgi:hypothetical protein